MAPPSSSWLAALADRSAASRPSRALTGPGVCRRTRWESGIATWPHRSVVGRISLPARKALQQTSASEQHPGESQVLLAASCLLASPIRGDECGSHPEEVFPPGKAARSTLLAGQTTRRSLVDAYVRGVDLCYASGRGESRSGTGARRPSPHREELSQSIVVGGVRSFLLPRSSWWGKQVKCSGRLRQELGVNQSVRGIPTRGSRAAQVNLPL